MKHVLQLLRVILYFQKIDQSLADNICIQERFAEFRKFCSIEMLGSETFDVTALKKKIKKRSTIFFV